MHDHLAGDDGVVPVTFSTGRNSPATPLISLALLDCLGQILFSLQGLTSTS